MNTVTAREIVILVRELRDGAITEERLERWLAELVIGCIPREEPLVAKARIMPLPVDSYRQNKYPMKRSGAAYRLALELARISGGLNLTQGPARFDA